MWLMVGMSFLVAGLLLLQWFRSARPAPICSWVIDRNGRRRDRSTGKYLKRPSSSVGRAVDS